MPSPLHAVEKYMAEVLDGTRVVGELETLAVQRQADDLATGNDRGLWFLDHRAERAIKFFHMLRHWKGRWSGQRFSLSPFQAFLVACVFGWYNEDGSRRYREAYNEMARKQGKTSLAAGIGVYTIIGDDEPGAETYSVATKREQAAVCMEDARQYVLASPPLSKRIRVLRNNLHATSSMSKMMPLASDSKRLDALNIHCCIMDELHQWKDQGLYDVLKTATGSRLSPLLFEITTAGDNTQSLCYEQRRYAERVLRGIISNDRFFAFVAAMDPNDDWHDQSAWPKANPNLDVSIKLSDLVAEYNEVVDQPRKQNGFRRFKLNQWVTQASRWIDIKSWDACVEDIPGDPFKDIRAWGGLDLAATKDINAFVMVGELPDGRVYVEPMFWVPEKTIHERAADDRVPYDVWYKQGFMNSTPGASTHYDTLRHDINKRAKQMRGIGSIGYDPWNGLHLAKQLIDDGFDMVKIGQGFSHMSSPSKFLEGRLAERQLVFKPNPVMRWMADNVAVAENHDGNIRPVKDKSSEKIDGIVAAIMAVARMIARDDKPESPYKLRGIQTIG